MKFMASSRVGKPGLLARASAFLRHQLSTHSTSAQLFHFNLSIVLYLTLLTFLWQLKCVTAHFDDHIGQKGRLRLQKEYQEEVNADQQSNLVDDDQSTAKERLNNASLFRNKSIQLIADQSNSSFSSFSSSIHHQFFTAESQQQYRREWNFTQVNLANSHLFYIRTKFSCSVPRAKLVKVLDYHTSPSKQYVPRCTVLHRCDEESGCCEEVTHRCEPSKTELVDLYFHVIRSDIKNNITGGNAVGIERLTFLNHTQCECKPINYMPRTVTIRPPMRIFVPKKQGFHHKCRHVVKCPQPFVQRFREFDQRCVCDCLGTPTATNVIQMDQYKQCLDIQSGTSKLDHFWARCVRAGECAEPVCPFGAQYSKAHSQCRATSSTDKHHRLRHPHNRHHLHHQHHFHNYNQNHSSAKANITDQDIFHNHWLPDDRD